MVFNPRSRVRHGATLIALGLAVSSAHAGEVFVGDWNGLVPHSMEILSDTKLKICREDLKLQCQYPIPYTKDGDTIVVEKFTDGLRWTYTPRTDGGYNATYDRWNGKDGYTNLATAILRAR